MNIKTTLLNNIPVWNDTFAQFSKEKALPYFLNDCAQKHPGKAAVKFNEEILTYRQLHESSNKLARLLIDNGIVTGDIVGLAVDRSLQMIISLLAIMKSGAAYVPLDPEYPKERIEFMLNDSSAKILLVSGKYKQYYNSGAAEIVLEEALAKLENYSAEEQLINVSGDDLAYILYTSGSTGSPKGAMIRHYSLVNLLLSTQKAQQIRPGDKTMAITTISFDMACTEIFLPLINGAQLIIADSETAKDGWLILDLLRKEQISYMVATPYTWRMVLAAGWDKPMPLKMGIGGEALTKELAAKLIPLGSALWNQYGPTETTIYSLQKLITDAEDITIGQPIDNTQVFILDDDGNNITDGSAGEIYIAGDGVAAGYINRPQLSEERFVNNPFSENPEDRMYRTGDLGNFNANGEIQFLGRIDQQVKIRGYRIEPEEIEHALLKLEYIKEAVVIAREDTPGNKRLAAYVVLANIQEINGDKLQVAEIQNIIGSNLPEYMIPDDIIYLASIPVTLNGKTDRKMLPKPVLNLFEKKSNYIAPRTTIEKQLTLIWQELMGIEQVSVRDNFFSLGGRSLVAVQIMSQIEKITGNHLPISTLLKYSTIEKLAIFISGDFKQDTGNSLVAIKPEGSKLPLYIVHGEGLNVLFFNSLAMNMDKEQPVYGLQAKGLDMKAEPLDVVEDIAASYITEIIEQNARGPYLIAGYSLGGYIATEMRKQLVDMGKAVSMFIIFDTDAEKSEFKSLSYLLPRKIKRNFPRAISFIKLKLRQLKAIRDEKSSHVQNNKETRNFYKRIGDIKNKYLTALKNYRIKPFDDKIYLFKAKICNHYVDDARFYGWKDFAKKGVELYEIPGNHLSMLESPNVEEFATILQKSINEHSNVIS